MNAPKHTPGPWHRNIKPASKYPTVWAGRNTHVAAVVPGAPHRSGNGCSMSEDEIEANINLIAAAPGLLQSLKEALGFLQDMNVTGDLPDTMRAAIEKAEPSHD